MTANEYSLPHAPFSNNTAGLPLLVVVNRYNRPSLGCPKTAYNGLFEIFVKNRTNFIVSFVRDGIIRDFFNTRTRTMISIPRHDNMR